MATPHVAGAVVLAEQMKRELTGTGFNTASRVEEALFKETSLDLGATGPDNSYGWGLVQLLNIRAELGPRIDTALGGFDATALPVLPQPVEFSATNGGGQTAFELSIEVVVPTAYLFLPGANFDITDLNTLYSDPAPASAALSEDGAFTILTYNVGTLAPEESFGFTSTLVPTLPGDYEVHVTTRFKDVDDRSFTQNSTFNQTVGLPA